jgi:glycosyltransferase involved in cell wall biosynthesis
MKKAVRVIKAADQVIAGNETLAEFASMWTRHVTVVPSCVAPERYRLKTSYELSDPPIIGWLGSLTAEQFLTDIEPALLHVNKTTGARLALIGSEKRQLGLLESMIDRSPWSEAAAQERPASWDIGIMPLPGGLYERGKCGYKLIQYAAAGLPAVASPVGANRRIIASCAASAAVTIADWVDALKELLETSSEVRRGRGRLARTAVEEGYSFNVWEPTWRQALLGRTHTPPGP